uniref:Tyr recombinase domain-containing protein n=1 Tax=Lygus hesperus TaxID=30085 RepID=A0A146MI88_LYGHE
MRSISDATIKQYSVSYKRWGLFCQEKVLDPWDPTPSSMVAFFQHVMDSSNISYNSINSYRAALSLIARSQVGCDPLVSRFLKGVARLRPPAPRYNITWNPYTVLDFLDREFSEIGELSKKLVTLFLLATGHRLQTIHLIRMGEISFSATSGVRIKITDPIKCSGPNKKQPLISIPPLQEKPNLCVVKNLQKYIDLTAPIRPTAEDFLFIISRPPYNRASKATLSRWVLSTLSDAGVDTSIFKPHSTRHAATSAASRAGVSIDIIRQSAGWSQRSDVFTQFYNRPLQEEASLLHSII